MERLKVLFIVLSIAVMLSGTLQAQGTQSTVPNAPGAHPEGSSVGRSVLAGLVTAVNIPLRGLLCVADAGMGFIVMAASAGRKYGQAAEVVEAGCSGPWFIDTRTVEEAQRKKPDDINKAFLATHP